jgi:hypothetical protein
MRVALNWLHSDDNRMVPVTLGDGGSASHN